MANKKVTMTDLRLLIREFIKGTSKHKISEKLDKTEHAHPIETVKSVQFWS